MGEDFTLMFHFGNFEIHRKLTIKRDRGERFDKKFFLTVGFDFNNFGIGVYPELLGVRLCAPVQP